MKPRTFPAVLSLTTALAAGLLSSCGFGSADSSGKGAAVVSGMSDEVLATDPASG